MSGYPTFSDFAADEIGPLDGAKRRIDDILNHQILITGFRIQDSRYDKNQSGKYLTIQFAEKDKERLHADCQ